ncbi:hypothetical protein F4813DRAFT_400222 [Daldinia decipiens]|uniref:uncharacterized protein n=1 Tax=Daldinia decipiens TaxID=326647 RepID=UPI0020C585CE|nr:uncharacterized protein F4813DRAFT_400222 [Daldinia decipiens]KAI1653301.1 hypothetical protein F4813DRAFT_400222 [Daldinia decipiens]
MAEAPFRLLYLPVELVSNICAYFLPDTLPPYRTFRDYDAARKSVTDLVNLTLVCKSLSIIAAPVLARCKGHPFQEGIIPYIYTILRNPDVASHETTFRLRPSDHNGLLQSRHIRAFDARARALVVLPPSSYSSDLIQQQNVDARDNSRIHEGRTNLMYLLLASLPNLSSYSIYGTLEPLFPINAPVSRFNALKHIRVVGYSDIPSSLDMGHFKRYTQYSRNVEVFEFVNMAMCNRSIHLDSARIIRLLSCRISSQSLRNAVRNCSSNLKTFVFRSGYYSIYLQQGVHPEDDWMKRRSDASPWDILSNLMMSPSRGSLETLEIDMREHFCARTWGIQAYPAPPETLLVYNFIRALKCFSRNLRNITLTQQTIWELWFDAYPGFNNEGIFCDEMRLIEMLPPSIESFALYDVTPNFLQCVSKFAQHVGSGAGLQNLKKFTLRPSPNFARQLTHARSHQDHPDLQFFDEHDAFCCVDETLLAHWGQIMLMLKSSGVEVDCVPEAYPLDTEDQEALRRQRELQHWCDKCHFDSSVCVEQVEWLGVYVD